MDSLYIEPETGGYITKDNKIVSLDSIISKINTLLLQPLGSNIYDLKSGNPLIDQQGIITPNDLAVGINKCLNPLMVSGDILSVVILSYSVDRITRRYTVNINATISNGTNVKLTWRN